MPPFPGERRPLHHLAPAPLQGDKAQIAKCGLGPCTECAISTPLSSAARVSDALGISPAWS